MFLNFNIGQEMTDKLIFENEYLEPIYKVNEPERVNHVLNILKSKELALEYIEYIL